MAGFNNLKYLHFLFKKIFTFFKYCDIIIGSEVDYIER